MPHPQSKRLIVASVLVFIVWAILLLGIAVVIIGSMKLLQIEGETFLLVANIFVVIGVFGGILGFPVKCLNCGKRLLLETESKSDKHFRAVRYPCLKHWASIVVDCLFKRKITCMYCGEEYETKWR